MPPIEILLALICILALAHAIETCLGFGSTVVALALGAFLLPLETLLPVIVINALLQSIWLLAQEHRHVDWAWLRHSILPVVTAGLALGIYLRDHASEVALLGILGGFTTLVSAWQLSRLRRQTPIAGLPHRSVVFGLLLSGGIFQGLFASGGPPIVYCAARRFNDPASFRATLAVLWLVLNLLVAASMIWSGQIDTSGLALSLAVLPGFLAGAAIGGKLRLDPKIFQTATWTLLLIVGLVQCGRVVSHLLS